MYFSYNYVKSALRSKADYERNMLSKKHALAKRTFEKGAIVKKVNKLFQVTPPSSFLLVLLILGLRTTETPTGLTDQLF